MKNNKKRLIIVLTIATMFIAAHAVSVSAASAPGKVSEFTVHPGYKSVILAWKPVSGADGYVVYYKKPDGNYVQYRAWTNKKKTLITYTVKDLAMYKDYAFRIAAFKYKNPKKKDPYDKSNRIGGTLNATVMAHGEPIRPMTYRLRMGGKTVVSDGFTAGMYIVNNFTGKGRYNVSKTRVSRVDPIFTRSWNYGKFAAERFVNDKGVSSGTNKLVWVSTYTQHAYYFEGSKGKWKLKDHWECSSGKPTAPTPTGNNYTKKIWKKVRTRHGIGWWSPFSSMNSIHGGYDRSDIGHPKSSGCVGNLDSDAQTVYYNAGLGTTVVIF